MQGASVLVTGGSGLLGRSVCAALAAAGYAVTPLSHSKVGPGLVPYDLRALSPASASELIAGHVAVVHCAAERRPDACEAHPAEARLLNTDVPGLLAAAAAQRGIFFIHISRQGLITI